MLAPKVIVVEDEEIIALDITSRLQKLGYHVLETTNSSEGVLEKVAERNPNIVLINVGLAGEMNGVQVTDIIQNSFQVPVIFLTNCSEKPKLSKKQLGEPFSYILKPFAERDLHVAIEMTLYKHKIEKRLQEEKQKLRAIVNSMGSGVIITDTNSRIQTINPVAEALTGWHKNEAFGKDLMQVLNLVNQDTGEVIENLVKEVIERNAVMPIPDNCILIAKNGTKIPIGDSIAPVRDRNGNITGTVLVFQDITQRKQTEAELLQNAFYDALTKLPNRVLFQDRLRLAIERSKRRSNYRFAVLFLDLDGFKGINDRFGHRTGDDLLVAVSRRLESCFRSGDTVARYGGDEFAVLLDEIKDVSEATSVANRILDTISAPLHLNGREIIISASIGIALNSNEYDQPENLLQNADTAMYRAKGQGKAKYAVFNFK
ncbi:MAG: diguanylate cyclase [Rhizonema sp. PD37]|nr:diguanylate cyclase [Rhizonema sp. PD37]